MKALQQAVSAGDESSFLCIRAERFVCRDPCVCADCSLAGRAHWRHCPAVVLLDFVTVVLAVARAGGGGRAMQYLFPTKKPTRACGPLNDAGGVWYRAVLSLMLCLGTQSTWWRRRLFRYRACILHEFTLLHLVGGLRSAPLGFVASTSLVTDQPGLQALVTIVT
jgi:hypothetical protein